MRGIRRGLVQRKDLRPQSLTKRKAALRRVVKAGVLDYVEAVKSPALFEAAARLDLEGIVAKRGADPYTAETRWVKVKNTEYSQKERSRRSVSPATIVLPP